MSKSKWKTKVRADLGKAGFSVNRGLILLHHKLHEPDRHDESDSEIASDEDDEEAIFIKSYPSMRALIVD